MGIDPVTHNPRLDVLDLSSILGSSFYNNPNSQINSFSRLIGIHNRLANSFMSFNNMSHFSMQNVENHEQSNMIISQSQLLPPQQPHYQIDQSPALPPLHEASAGCSPSTTTSCGGEAYLFPSSNFSDFYSQNCQQQTQELNGFDYSECALPSYDFYKQEQEQEQVHQQVIEPSPETSTLNSSPTPLNSNSTYFSTANGNGTDQDEKESYCSDFFKFEIPDLLDVNPFV